MRTNQHLQVLLPLQCWQPNRLGRLQGLQRNGLIILDMPNPQLWERFASKSTSTSAAPSVVAESLASWINVPSSITEQETAPPEVAKDEEDMHL
eukprot:3130537-Amphidinium_carterae.2